MKALILGQRFLQSPAIPSRLTRMEIGGGEYLGNTAGEYNLSAFSATDISLAYVFVPLGFIPRWYLFFCRKLDPDRSCQNGNKTYRKILILKQGF